MGKFTNYHFSGQKNGEKVITVVHRHWFNIVIQYLPLFGFLCLIVIVNFYLPSVNSDFANAPFSTLQYFIETLLLMIIICIASIIWIDYYFDVWIITDERVIDIEQKGLFIRVVSELKVSRIQDVSTSVRGLFPTIFNYGDLRIQTAGTAERFRFIKVPNPYGLKDILMEMQKRKVRQETDEIGEVIQQKINK